MPTSTTTMTVPVSLKVSKLPVSARTSPSAKSAIASLRSLYPRAARAFLQRDVILTHSLLLSAFLNLQAPVSPFPDSLASHRRKWDILRITLETTVYSTVPPMRSLPESLHSLLSLSPPSLITTMYTRSLQLFTPANCGKPSSEFLPSQILVALVLASVKLDCVQIGREMVEAWLACRNQPRFDSYHEQKQQARDDSDGYEKILEIFCLHVLPRLEDWDYAREFLRYESELSQDKRAYLSQSLQILHAQHVAQVEEARGRESSIFPSPSSSRTVTPKPNLSRPPSPTPSVTSTSSNSTHTAVPLTPRPQATPSSSLPPGASLQTPASSRSSLATLRPAREPRHATSLPVPPKAPQIPVVSVPERLSLLALVRTSLVPHLTRSRVTFLMLLLLVPLVSFVFRLRWKRLRLGPRAGGSAGAGAGAAVGALVPKPRGHAVDETRRRLKAGWWTEIQRSVTDAVRMAGGGLV